MCVFTLIVFDESKQYKMECCHWGKERMFNLLLCFDDRLKYTCSSFKHIHMQKTKNKFQWHYDIAWCDVIRCDYDMTSHVDCLQACIWVIVSKHVLEWLSPKHACIWALVRASEWMPRKERRKEGRNFASSHDIGMHTNASWWVHYLSLFWRQSSEVGGFQSIPE